MSVDSSPLPRRRQDLIIRDVGEGEFVVKHPEHRAYFRLGVLEHFMLISLDDCQTEKELRKSFEMEFGEALTSDEVNEFLELARARQLIDEPQSDEKLAKTLETSIDEDDDEEDDPYSSKKQSIVYWKKSLFDPDELFSWLQPSLWFLWTLPFFIFSLIGICSAIGIAIANWSALSGVAPYAVRWETVAIAWCTLIGATILHEFAHGLTCKRYGGEVHEIGVLFILFTPCLFCNISDAWLMRRKSHRLWTTFAGGYSDMCVAAVAVFIWRLTVPQSFPNYIAWVIATVCGGRVLFNFNPFSKMDGYFLLSDWLDTHNLRSRSLRHWKRNVRWLLWGAEKPEPVPNGTLLIGYGLAMWLFAALFLCFVLSSLDQFIEEQIVGIAVSALLTFVVSKRVFKGFFGGEVMTMVKTRYRRTAVWLAILIGTPLALFAIPVHHTKSGTFHVRPDVHSEARANIAGFLESVAVQEGDLVEVGDIIASMRISEIRSMITRKEAEIRETEANLSRLRTGARPELIAEQKARVRRAEAWRDMAKRDLDRARKTFEMDLMKLDFEIQQANTELEFAHGSLTLAQRLYDQGAFAGESLRAEKKRLALLKARKEQSLIRRKTREAEGILAAEEEVVRREKEAQEAQASLTLLEAGSRPEEIRAEVARRERLQEELEFLQRQREQSVIKASVAGIVSTPRLHERIGQYIEKGALICTIEDAVGLNVEIDVPEEDIQDISKEQKIELKARSLPYETFAAVVDRVAPSALVEPSATPAAVASAPTPAATQNSLTVYCHVDNNNGLLKPGMTGLARVYCGRRSLGLVITDRFMRYLRTEFWW